MESNERNVPDTTVKPKSSQGLFSVKLKSTEKDTGFAERLRDAFGGISNTDIAKKLGVKPPSVTDYMSGKTPLPKDKLLLVSELTNCNLHYLITGEGDPGGNQFAFLSESKQKLIQVLADRAGISFERMLNVLILDALAQRASDLFANFKRLNPQDRYELILLSELLRDEDEGRLRRSS